MYKRAERITRATGLKRAMRQGEYLPGAGPWPMGHPLHIQTTLGNQAVQQWLHPRVERENSPSANPPPPVAVTISGASELWWFNGESPAGYAVSRALTANSGGIPRTFTWRITSGSTFARFCSPPSGPTANICSRAPSAAQNDVRVRVNFAGSGGQIGRATRTFTVQSPRRLRFIHDDDHADPSFVYETKIYKKVVDQFGADLPRDMPVNEQFTVAPTADFHGMDWRPSTNQGGQIGPSAGWLFDIIQGETPGHTPAPVLPTDSHAGVRVNHWPGIWRVGSAMVGRGRRVGNVTWQKYRGYARHL